MREKGLGVSPITNKIYYGTKDTEKHEFIGEITDVTDSAIAAVFEWFIGNMEGNEEYTVAYRNTEYELVMRKKCKNERKLDKEDKE